MPRAKTNPTAADDDVVDTTEPTDTTAPVVLDPDPVVAEDDAPDPEPQVEADAPDKVPFLLRANTLGGRYGEVVYLDPTDEAVIGAEALGLAKRTNPPR